ncbi:PspC domain-containing protein [Gaetbulibacter jejuensis]|uniref:PspC domain-containing protein n=1 Tax=Gaetbulibacter jejuensis TaxID=584607 RepID=UPI00300B8627
MVKSDKKLVAGVISTLAEYVDVPIWLLRAVFLVFFFGIFGLSFGIGSVPVIIIYYVISAMIPDKKRIQEKKLEEIKKLYKKSLITKEEFDNKKREILNTEN